jgi:hypothetical protein
VRRQTPGDTRGVPRRDFLRVAGRSLGVASLALWLTRCAAGGSGRQYGWEGVRSIGKGRYRVQVWEPIGGHTVPTFFVLLMKANEPAATIFEPYGVTNYDDVENFENVVNELRARYPNLRSSELEVEPVLANNATIGYAIKTRNLEYYVSYDKRGAQYVVRLSGRGKRPPHPTGGAGGAGAGR